MGESSCSSHSFLIFVHVHSTILGSPLPFSPTPCSKSDTVELQTRQARNYINRFTSSGLPTGSVDLMLRLTCDCEAFEVPGVDGVNVLLCGSC